MVRRAIVAGMPTPTATSPSSLAGALRACGFVGRLVEPADADFDSARAGWNGAVDRRPAAVAYATDADDVAAAIRAAARRRPALHDPRGRPLRLRPLGARRRALHRHPRAQQRRGRPRDGASSASAAARCSRELDAATQEHGLAVPAGQISHTGVGGLTLGGGMGWLMRRHGLTVDSLESAEVVLADGRIAQASAGEHPDLFWALRGGGGDFAAVTELRVPRAPRRADRPRRHARLPVGAGAATRCARRRDADGERARRAHDLRRRWSPRRPRRRSPSTSRAAASPPSRVAWCGDVAEGERCSRRCAPALPPALDLVGPMPYVALQSMLDADAPHGWQLLRPPALPPRGRRRLHRRRCSRASSAPRRRSRTS